MIDLFLNHLDLILEADGDAKRLQDAVLQLAVSGRLVTREDPGCWMKGSFSDLGTVNPRVKRDDEDIIAGFLPMPNVPVTLDGLPDYKPRPWGEIKKGYTRFEEGDLLVAKITPCFQNGKACVARGIPGGVGAGTTELYVFRPNPELGHVDYFHLLVRTPEFVEGGAGTFTGTAGQQRVAKDFFANRIWAVPPLPEQHRIVEKVDELMDHASVLEERHQAASSARVRLRDSALHALAEAEDAEAVETAWQRIETHFEDLFTEPEDIAPLRQTILQLAVRGRLVAQDPEDEPASVLLEKIAEEKQRLYEAGEIKRPKKLPPVDLDEVPFDVPEGWVFCCWNDLIDHSNHAMKRGPFGSAIRKADFVSKGIRVFEQYNPINDDPEWARYFISNEKYESLKAFTAGAGDLLVSCSGTLGRICILPSDVVPGVINQALLKITLNKLAITNNYFVNVFRSEFVQRTILAKSLGAAQQNMVGVKVLRQLLFPLPPLAEQHRIVAKVDELMSLCDEVESRLKEAKQARERFASSVSAALVSEPAVQVA